MDEIIAQVAARTGLPPEQARAAAQAVIDHLKTRMPAALASHLDGLVNSGGSEGTTGAAGAAGASAASGASQAGGLGGLAGELGGLFGKK